MHYYKRNLGDYAKKAGRLSMLQHGSYTLLIDACYDREQFPTLEEAIEWTWASTTEEIEAVTFVLRKFFDLEDGVFIQKRIQEEITEYHGKAVTNKRIAEERERKRRESLTDRDEKSTNRAPVVNEAPPNHEPITNNQEPKEEKTPAAPAFVLPDWIPAETWAAYCKVRTGKKAKNEPHALGLIVKDLEKFRQAGHDPVDCLNNSIKSGWAGVFEPKAKFADKGAVPPVSTVWHESAAGVIAKAAELELPPRDEVLETFPKFKARVMAATRELVEA